MMIPRPLTHAFDHVTRRTARCGHSAARALAAWPGKTMAAAVGINESLKL